MTTAMTLTAKGQFTFNKNLMEHLGIKAGDKVWVQKQPDGSLKIEAAKKQIDFLSLAGTLRTQTYVSDADLEQAIANAYVQQGLKGLE